MYTIYVEKKPQYRAQEAKLQRELEAQLGIRIEELRILHMYYREEPLSEEALTSIFCEPSLDEVSHTFTPDPAYRALRVEYQSGQFDQRAYWAEQCLRVLSVEGSVAAATIYLVKGVNEEEWQAIRNYLINPVESREIPLGEFPKEVKREDPDLSFTPMPLSGNPEEIVAALGLALSPEDIEEIRVHFEREGRDPNWSELKFLETYWSDHCRHTTFHTNLTEVNVVESGIDSASADLGLYETYRKEWGKPRSLMDLALFSMRRQKRLGNLSDLEESEEINAASVVREAGGEEILLMFKNETHNHPTEIEPFGGAATCLGGAIRDPLSGRSYVYQSMRLTGARDPRDKSTLEGKLPQMTICRRAAEGFSSYGNQMGLATGCVQEFYHPGFEAKRLEAGFVIAAAKKSHVTRGNPSPGDLLVLLGAPTGRDGIGGASGSSKSHHEQVVAGSASEVQKGNAPEERKLQRFFRDEVIGPKIVRCNDLGAGGIGVAFGEIADGLELELSDVPLKYTGIYPWEMLLSESQERMALVIRKEDRELFEAAARRENLSMRVLGEVTEEPRFVVKSRGDVLVSLSREFLLSAGAERSAAAKAAPVDFTQYPYAVENEERQILRYASQQGLGEMFDSSVGSLSVLTPYGGERRKSPVEGMVGLIPIGENTEDVSFVSWGYDPHLAQWSPYHGAQSAVLLSLLRNLCLGADIAGTRFTFQEYFERLGNDPERWGKPLMALLGANSVLEAFALASIGGKDSMSGTYRWEGGEIHVPPTLISFAVNTGKIQDVLSPEWKQVGSYLYLLPMPKKEDFTFDLEKAKESAELFLSLREGLLSASVVEGSLKETLLRSAFGNGIGAKISLPPESYGAILLESEKELVNENLILLGRTTDEEVLSLGEEKIDLTKALQDREETLSEIYEIGEKKAGEKKDLVKLSIEGKDQPSIKALLPIFAGTNCEDDMSRALREAGAEPLQWVFKDREMETSLQELSDLLDQSDILALSGGFSAADEPEGSAKFIATVLRNEKVSAAFHRLLDRGGLVIGICNGFQALVKLGVFYESRIRDPREIDMGLTYNAIGRHIAEYVDTVAASTHSPWLQNVSAGEVYRVPVSHGEGRFYATKEDLALLKERGQIASVYLENPNASLENIEGLISPCGKILGKMGHSERVRSQTGKNAQVKEDMQLFASAVAYLKGAKK